MRGMVGRRHSEATLAKFRALRHMESDAYENRRYRNARLVPGTTLELTPDERGRYSEIRAQKTHEAGVRREAKRFEFPAYSALMRGSAIVYLPAAQ